MENFNIIDAYNQLEGYASLCPDKNHPNFQTLKKD